MIIVASDFHIPYHSVKMLRVLLKIARDNDVKKLVINGDFIDCYALSSFDKNPSRLLSFKRELDVAHNIFTNFKTQFKEIDYNLENHENRFKRVIWKKIPELSNLDNFSLERLMRLRELDIKSHEKGLKLNGFFITHGDVVRQHASYSAKAMYEKYGGNIIHGHTHRIGRYGKRVGGKQYRVFETGCMCDLNPSYCYKPNWSQGFGILNGKHFTQIEPVNNEIRFNGKSYKL